MRSPRLPPADRLLARYAQHRDPADMEELVRRFRDERRVLRLRFADERTLGEIGRELAVAPAQAARLLRSSVAHLSEPAA